MTFTPALSGMASAGKSSRKLKKKRKAVSPSAPQNQQSCLASGPDPNPSCHLIARSTSWVLLALSLKLLPRLAPWLPSLNGGFYGKRFLTNFFVSIVGLQTTFFLASSQAPVWEGWHADATFQIDGVPKILQPMPETETLHVRYLMQGKTKPFYKHSNFLGYFSSANYEIRRLGRSILQLPLWGHRPQRSSYT